MIRNWATNPFKPGAAGRMPPHIAGREREKSAFDDCIRELTRSEEPQAILLVGPRGCGKTVLLNWCKARARSINGNIRVKEFTREVPTTMAGIARELLDNIFDVRYPDEIVARAKVGIVGAEGKWSTEPTDMMVMDALIEECRKSPLLLILEEAAETSPEGLGALFNEAIHQGRQEINMENIESVAAEVKSERSVTYATRYREWSASDKNILAGS